MSEPHSFSLNRPDLSSDPLRRPILAPLDPAAADGSAQWFGFDDEERRPPASFVGFDDEPPEAPSAPTAAEPTAPAVLPVRVAAPAPRRPVPTPRPAAAARLQAGRQSFLVGLSLLLLAYALFGRSAAYIGLRLGEESGIFVGDLVLLFGLGLLMIKGDYEQFFALPVAMPWLFFVTWNAAQTLPYFSQYGLTTLRDAAEWGYSFYAVVLGTMLLARPGGFEILIRNYRRFVVIFALLLPAVIALSIYYEDHLSAGQLGLGYVRFGDALVNLAGVVAFATGGLVAVRSWWWWLVGVEFVALASHNRGGLLAFLGSLLLLLFFNLDDWRGTVRRFAGFGGALALMLLVSFVVDLRVNAYQNQRAISPQQLIVNLAGSFENTGESGLDGTREWRLEWWNKIIRYTVHGDYFWTGKGYGINLAEDDGFLAENDSDGLPLRSPHNFHLTFLARAGVPGIALWILLQVSWVFGVMRAFLFARRTRRKSTAALMTFFIAFWTAEMLEAATDVTLEAPYAAIWFWTIFGIAMASVAMLARDPDFFERALAGARPVRQRVRPKQEWGWSGAGASPARLTTSSSPGNPT